MKINLDALKQISDDPSFIQEIVTIFKEDMPKYLADLHTQRAEENDTQLIGTLHKMKSALNSLGLLSLNTEINLLEEKWSIYQPEERQEKVMQVIEATRGLYEKIKPELDKLTESQPESSN
jgi:HPt (histidine-containing phosphotransfer) domain-containing protein